MMNWRTAAVLLGISSLLACAKATLDDGYPTGGTGAADNGGAPIDDQGGAGPVAGAGDIGGAPPAGAGAPARAGASSGGAQGRAGAAATGGRTGGTGGAPGTAGKSGGTAGAGVAGAGGGSAGSASTGPCDNPKDVTGGNSMSFDTTDAVCLRTKETFNTLGCSNFAGRTIKVNGTAVVCTDNTPAKAPFAAAIDGYNYFDVSAGTLSYADIFWFSS